MSRAMEMCMYKTFSINIERLISKGFAFDTEYTDHHFLRELVCDIYSSSKVYYDDNCEFIQQKHPVWNKYMVDTAASQWCIDQRKTGTRQIIPKI